MEITLRISPDGKKITCLYSDELQLDGLGKPEIVRASEVRYSQSVGLWYVYEFRPGGEEIFHVKGFNKRGDAIQYEISLLEARLQEDPASVEEVIEDAKEVRR